MSREVREHKTCSHNPLFRRRDTFSTAVPRRSPGFSETVRETCDHCGAFLFEHTMSNAPEHVRDDASASAGGSLSEADYIQGLKTVLPQREEG